VLVLEDCDARLIKAASGWQALFLSIFPRNSGFAVRFSLDDLMSLFNISLCSWVRTCNHVEW
jgi:hypothetical protein